MLEVGHTFGHTFSVSSENKEEELVKYQWSSKFFPKKFVILGGQTIEKSSKIAVKCLNSAFFGILVKMLAFQVSRPLSKHPLIQIFFTWLVS